MNEPKATRYQRLRRRADGAGLVAGAVALALLACTRASTALAAWSRDIGASLIWPLHALVSIIIFVTAVVAVWEIVALPAVLYSGVLLDRQFRRGSGSLAAALAAQAHATVIALSAAWFMSSVALGAARLSAAWWWLIAGSLLAIALVAAARSAPALVIRLTGARTAPRSHLTGRLQDIARRAGVPIAEIDEWDAGERGAVAFVAGVGSNRRVFLSSEMLRDWTDDEIAVVVAHELGHHARHDLWRTIGGDALMLGGALWAADRVLRVWPAAWGGAAALTLASLPLVALVGGAAWLALAPVRHAQSRAQERRADRFALDLTHADAAFAAAVRRLGAHRLIEERPSRLTQWLYYRHPSVEERLALAARFRDAQPPHPVTGRRRPSPS